MGLCVLQLKIAVIEPNDLQTQKTKAFNSNDKLTRKRDLKKYDFEADNNKRVEKGDMLM